MKNGYVWRGIAVTFLTAAIFSWGLGIESTFLLMIIGLVLWGLLELLIFFIKTNSKQLLWLKLGLFP